MVQETVSMEGHLIDSDILRKTFDRIVEGGGEFEVLDFHVGRTNDEASRARLTVSAPDPATLDRILESLTYLGAAAEIGDARFEPAEADGTASGDDVSTDENPQASGASWRRTWGLGSRGRTAEPGAAGPAGTDDASPADDRDEKEDK